MSRRLAQPCRRRANSATRPSGRPRWCSKCLREAYGTRSTNTKHNGLPRPWRQASSAFDRCMHRRNPTSWRFGFVLTAFGCGVWSGVAVQWQPFPTPRLPQLQKSADWHRPSPPLPRPFSCGDREHVPRPSSLSPPPPVALANPSLRLHQTSAPSNHLDPLLLCCASGTEPRGFACPLGCPANPCRPSFLCLVLLLQCHCASYSLLARQWARVRKRRPSQSSSRCTGAPLNFLSILSSCPSKQIFLHFQISAAHRHV
ncbi:uncharacterized protein J3D65DRAFT_690431 [Phyllosticta citribraziliensis]|uniref:Uncharacterized protein n=1 Tax=Phyllosticta citribraziliensis TaxID=989973 RepID=A0ABR1M4A2_9PEZI